MVELPQNYTGTVYVYCFDDNSPTGGIKKLYRQVDLLNKNGVSAKVLHQRPGFRCTWFENSTPVTCWADKPTFRRNDVILVPEVLGPNAIRIVPGVSKVIFNQNGFYTFHQHSPALGESRDSPYIHEDIIAALTVSEASVQYLGHAFPKLPLFRIYNSIDPEIFSYVPEKKRQLCFMPRKNKDDAEQVLNILKYRGALKGVEVVTIEGKSEAEVAAIMQESPIFMSFGYPEGFGLPPAEAMACGSIAIGYHGVGGLEFFTPEYGYPIEYGDIVGFAKTVEQVLGMWDTDRETLTAIGKHASNFIHTTYSDAAEERTTLEAWANILRIQTGELPGKPAEPEIESEEPAASPSKAIDPFAPIDPDRKLFVQTLLMAPAACADVRAIEPSRLLSRIPGVRAITSKKNAVLSAAEADEEKVFVWQRAILTPDRALKQQRNLIERGYLTVAEIDEDPSRWPDIEKSDYFAYRSCHCVQTASEPLAEVLRQYNPHVKVFKNHLTQTPVRRNPAEFERATIFFGAIDRDRDWKPLIDAINRVIDETGNFVRVEVIHDRAFFDAIETRNKNFTPFAPYDVYLTILKRCTVAVLPLANTARNRMKSDLKFLECGGHGLAVLASDVVYGETVKDGETGLIYRSPDEFEEKLREIVVDTELRQRLSENAMDWVTQHRLLENHARERAEWYLEMRDRLPELNADLKARVPELFAATGETNETLET